MASPDAIGPIGSDRPIGWTRIAPNGEAALRRMRDGSRHAAIVAVTVGGKPGLCPVNAGVVQRAVRAAGAAGVERAARGDRRRGVLRGSTSASSRTRRGSARRPSTSWRRSTARDPRAAAGLRDDAAQRLARERVGARRRPRVLAGDDACGRWRARPTRTVKFVASSGHELGHLGLHDYLRRNPTLARDAFAWVHFGANIGTSTGDIGMTRVGRSPARRGAARVRAARSRDDPAVAGRRRSAGKRRRSGKADGRFVSFIGANAWFHNPRDLWPDAVDIQAVARFARAAADLTLQLANAPAAQVDYHRAARA